MKPGEKIALVGAGAVGLYYGARLALAGDDVSFLLRSDFEVVRREGIRLESVDGDARLRQVKAFRDPREIGPVDWVIVAWKATANRHLAEVLGPLRHGSTRVLTLQNGLGNCESLAAVAGPKRVLGGLCFVCLNRLAPGLVRHTAGGRVTIGEWLPEPGFPRARGVAAAFEAAGVKATPVEDLEAAQWRKLVWNIPFNGLAIAEGGVATDRLLADSRIEAEVAALMREVIAVARAKGHEFGDGVVDFEIGRTRPMGAYRPSSMIDYIEGRSVEFEAIWGEPLRQAREAGVPVPRLERLAARIGRRLRLEGLAS